LNQLHLSLSSWLRLRDLMHDGPLSICLLSYRSNPFCGGQGVYVKHLSRALKSLGHRVEIISGPPRPEFDGDIPVTFLSGLDLYDPANLFRVPSLMELVNPINLMEWIGVSTMGFPEPFTFGLRAYQELRRRLHHFDIVHDNQSLSYGVWAIARLMPTIATIHHPITIDRRIAVQAATNAWQRWKQWRWHSFVGMQIRVARRLRRIITVSKSAQRDVCSEFGVPPDRFRVVPNGIDTGLFHPIPGIEKTDGHILVTNSADVPLKGLSYLLQAVAAVSKQRSVHLIVVGAPKHNGSVIRLIRSLGIGHLVEFTGRINQQELVKQYARARMAVIPSVYEGFGLPAGEAMACSVPVISTTGGALPEVVGDAGILVPPADPPALAGAIRELLGNPDRARRLGQAGYQRVIRRFTWEKAAAQTVEAYREAIDDHRRLSQAKH
jgi:MMP alpha-(1->4)-mannosyltransferase